MAKATRAQGIGVPRAPDQEFDVPSSIMPTQGWNLPASTARQIRLLEYLVDASTASSYYVGLPDWVSDPRSEAYAAAVTDLDLFEDSGFVSVSRTLAGPPHVHLLAPGVARVEEVRALRGERRERNQQVRDALLHWLHDCHLVGVDYPGTSDFVRSPFGQSTASRSTRPRSIAQRTGWRTSTTSQSRTWRTA
jgi:hypothetical protein